MFIPIKETIVNNTRKDLRFEGHDDQTMNLVLKEVGYAVDESIRLMDKSMEENIGLLRQWLNEDRITDGSKMVTSDQIRHWLYNRK